MADQLWNPSPKPNVVNETRANPQVWQLFGFMPQCGIKPNLGCTPKRDGAGEAEESNGDRAGDRLCTESREARRDHPSGSKASGGATAEQMEQQ